MKRKNGFTLIELLAVIVILAIIALIAVPIVLNMINSAKKKAAESGALGFIEAIEYNNGFAQTEQAGYTEINGENLDVTSSVFDNLKMKGKKPTSGTVTIVNGKVTSATGLCVEGYIVTYDGKDASVGDKCSGSSSSTPEPQTPVVQVNYGCTNCVYATFDDGTNGKITQASEGTTTRPTNYNSYFGYQLTNGEIAEGTLPVTCFYSETYGGEFCLKYGEFATSLQKIKDYFGYNEETWTYKTEIRNQGTEYEYEYNYYTDPTEKIKCEISDTEISCYDSEVRAVAYSNGLAHTRDLVTKYACDISYSEYYSNIRYSCYYE